MLRDFASIPPGAFQQKYVCCRSLLNAKEVSLRNSSVFVGAPQECSLVCTLAASSSSSCSICGQSMQKVRSVQDWPRALSVLLPYAGSALPFVLD